LYDWNTAKTACPTGWHLPTSNEWEALVTAAGGSATGNTTGTKLKAKSPVWNGTDDYGFSALPGGSRNITSSFADLGTYGRWWTSTETASGTDAYYRYMSSASSSSFGNNSSKNYGYSVRCVQ
jgi:uncharacterized protein (TIGR02145 family)